MTHTNSTRGDRLRECREGSGHENKSDFARKIEVRPETLWRFETNKIQPSAEVLVRAAHITGFSIEYLVKGTGPKRLPAAEPTPPAAA